MNISEKRVYLQQFYNVSDINKISDTNIVKLVNDITPKKDKISNLSNIDSLVVNSNDGFVRVNKWRNKGIKTCYRVRTERYALECSNDHFIEMHNGKWKYTEYILPGEYIKTIDGIEQVLENIPIGNNVVYDFHIDHENHRYYTNGISSHNSGSGKSLFMQNLSLNWLEQGLNGIFITLELSEDLSSMRVDSMITGKATKDLFKNLDDVETLVKLSSKKMGQFQIKYLPAQSTINDVRAYVKEFQIKSGVRIDFICADYLDLFMPVSVKVNPSDVFIKDKYVSEELRNLAKELNVIFVTASQLNRGSVEQEEFDHSHIAGGISKINTADNVFGIFTSMAMRERGRYQLQAMKTRSSSGVGQKIDLDFNVESLRITDPGIDQQGRDNSSFDNSNSSSIMNSIKNKATLTTDGGPPTATMQSAALNKLLNKINS